MSFQFKDFKKETIQTDRVKDGVKTVFFLIIINNYLLKWPKNILGLTRVKIRQISPEPGKKSKVKQSKPGNGKVQKRLPHFYNSKSKVKIAFCNGCQLKHNLCHIVDFPKDKTDIYAQKHNQGFRNGASNWKFRCGLHQ